MELFSHSTFIVKLMRISCANTAPVELEIKILAIHLMSFAFDSSTERWFEIKVHSSLYTIANKITSGISTYITCQPAMGKGTTTLTLFSRLSLVKL